MKLASNLSNTSAIKVLVLLVLSIASILFFNTYDRYVANGPELLKNIQLNGGNAEWNSIGQEIHLNSPSPGTVELHSSNPQDSVTILQKLTGLSSYRLIRLSADIKTNDVVQNLDRWMSARVVFIPFSANGKPMYDHPHALVNLVGTNHWNHYEGIFILDPKISWIQVGAQLEQTTGTMWFKNISARPVIEANSFNFLRLITTLLWAGVIAWIASTFFIAAAGNKQRLVILIIAFTIAIGVLMPEPLKEYIGKSIFPDFVNPVAEGTGLAPVKFKFTLISPILDIYKAGHFLLFAMLSMTTFSRKAYPASRIQMLGCLILFAFVTEVMQLLVPGRSAQLGDVLIDSTGIVTGWIFLRLSLIFKRAL